MNFFSSETRPAFKLCTLNTSVHKDSLTESEKAGASSTKQVKKVKRPFTRGMWKRKKMWWESKEERLVNLKSLFQSISDRLKIIYPTHSEI